MPKAPQAEGVFQIGQLFAQLVQVPVLLRVAVDHQPGVFDRNACRVGLSPVSLGVGVRHIQTSALQKPQAFVVQRGRFVGRLHDRRQIRAMRVGLQHGRVLVAHRKLDASVLPALETTRLCKIRADGAVLGRGHGGQHVPSVYQLLHDAADAGEFFEGVGQLVLRDVRHGGLKLVQHQLHPQLARLVLHDEQHLVVVGRERFLGVQDGVELQVVAVAHAAIKVELGVLFVHDALASG